jgi:hypothetical protein
MSSTGQYQTAVVFNGGYIYTSSDNGATWVERTAAGYRSWLSVSMSSTGQYQTAVVYGGGYIYTSTAIITVTTFTFNLDTGSTFFLTGTAPTANYTANFTISVLNTSRSYLITLINTTSTRSTYYCNSVSINGTAIPAANIVWTVPIARISLTGAAKTNQEFVLYYNTTESKWYVTMNIKKF